MVSVDELICKKVITARAYILGDVQGAEVDVDNWRITHLQVKLSDKASTDLGFKKRFRSSTVCMPVTLIKAVGEVVTIDKSLEELSRTRDIVECRE